jgi:hypothetical protein
VIAMAGLLHPMGNMESLAIALTFVLSAGTGLGISYAILNAAFFLMRQGIARTPKY